MYITEFWRRLWRPSRLAMATLLIIGGIGGGAAIGGFGAFMAYSNTEEFCISCHEMTQVWEEYKHSPHAKNESGVGATCSDCHVPKSFGPKLVRKIQATSELYHAFMGTIDTKEKFEAKRFAMASKVWNSMKASDSLECRNCHSFERMNTLSQRGKAPKRHDMAMERGETCIDCHKGIAHEYPDTREVIDTARQELIALAQKRPVADRLYPMKTLTLRKGPGENNSSLGLILAAAPLDVLDRQEGWVQVRLEAWNGTRKKALLYAAADRPIIRAGLKKSGRRVLEKGKAVGPGALAAITGWVRDDGLVADPEAIWRFAALEHETVCARCHRAYPAGLYTPTEWAGHMKAMKPYAELDTEDERLIQVYLQTHAKLAGPSS